jgi:hypothetical protein
MITIVFSRKRVFKEIGIIIRYSIREELPTVATLVAIELMKAMMTMKLKIVDPYSMLSAIIERKNSHPSKSEITRITQRITIAITAAAM